MRNRHNAFGKLVAEYGGTVPQDEGGVKFYLQDSRGAPSATRNEVGSYVPNRSSAFGDTR
ncbi:MAG: hypothetical protein IPJ30_17065 [Acidobacteria bacterium]|nr:hypothetical protein [Acidobacteriota bacterium]